MTDSANSSLPPVRTLEPFTGFRLINSKFPPISLFDDVADESEFQLLYQLQALTNPRIQTEIGNLNLINPSEIPFGITGCSYAISAFTHVNPDGSRFSDGQFGVLYIADSVATAVKEVAYHQGRYWAGVHGLDYDRFVFRGLRVKVGEADWHDATEWSANNAIYDPVSYTASRTLGKALKKEGASGLQYFSVRNPGALCWGLFTPRHVKSVVQSTHFEFVWNGEAISGIHRVSKI
ncbi:RES family NAD+ phosphorylase [Marinobacter sp. CHS3-4]|uniref:RES family NAD+ phosphorylase n=1 Tax=Marinobacter sp. CHS3-4 TaxID=3045174 RepID=UPI0024B526B9|nr:RES family NAD+ phosphorylase [Marinobacter sp. CHS3-4]MDI9245394.1 RES family NAD+ phosphorylase [Marinobacter sp. CHS3-4]